MSKANVEETLYTYRNVCMPNYQDGKKIPTPGGSFIDKLKSIRPHFFNYEGELHTGELANEILPTRPMIFTISKGSYPDPPENKLVFDYDNLPKYGPEELYLHVYGRYPSHILELQDKYKISSLFDLDDKGNNEVGKATFDDLYFLINPQNRAKAVKNAMGQIAKFSGFVGSKLIFKRPSQGAAGGPRFMVKIYMAGRSPVSASRIKTSVTNTSNIFSSMVYNSTLAPYSEYLVAKNAATIGELIVKSKNGDTNTVVKDGPYDTFTKKPEYKYIDVCYRDIKYNNNDRFVVDEIKDGIDILSKRLEKLLEYKDFNSITKIYFKSRLDVVKKMLPNMVKQKWGLNEFKKIIIKFMFAGGFKNCVSIMSVRSVGFEICKTNLGYNDSIVTGDMVKVFVLNVIQMQYLVSSEIKLFWKEVVRPKLFTPELEKDKEMLIQKIGTQLRTLCFDIETSYVPHSNEEQEVTMIHTVLYNEGAHDCPIEQKSFHYVAPQRQTGKNYNVPLSYDRVIELCDKQLNTAYDFELRTWFKMLKVTDDWFKDIPEFLRRFKGYAEKSKSKIKLKPGDDLHGFSEIPEDIEVLLDACRRMIKPPFDLNMKPGINYFIENYETEKEMLIAFLQYIRNCKMTTITHYNGDTFDLPFVINRCEQLKIDGMKPYKYKDEDNRRRSFNFRLSNRHDSANIKYKREAKIADSTRKKNAVASYLEKKKAAEFGSDEFNVNDQFGFEDETPSIDDERVRDVHKKDLDPDEKRPYKPMTEARSIFTLQFNHVGSRDVMKMVPDQAPNADDKKLKDKTLNSSAFSFLGLVKIDDPAVSYDNLCNTWKSGDLNVFVAYCAVDTLLTMKIDQYLKSGLNGIATSVNVYLPMRELYGNQSLVRTLAIMYSYQWYKNIVSPDVGVNKNEDRFWTPGYVFNVMRDFSHLKPRAGRTISDIQGVYSDYISVLCDFNSQYPSVMQCENICISTLLTEDMIKTMNPEDYTTHMIPNMRPSVYHACDKKNRGHKCTMNLNNANTKEKPEEQLREEYGQGCHWAFDWIYIEYPAHFAKKSIMRGIAGECSENLLAKRKKYKKLMAQANADGNETEAVIYDVLQLVMKQNANSIYGILLLLCSITGGAVTHIARKQNEAASEYLQKKCGGQGMAMADTDSLSPVAGDLPLMSQVGDDPEDMGPLNRISRRLKPGCNRPKISELVKIIDDRYKGYMDDLNFGVPSEGIEPAWQRPANLEIEKVLIGLVFIQKKNYYALKMEPGGHLATHVAGLACKRADKTKIKCATQLVLLKMLVECDYEGYVQYATDLYSISAVKLRAVSAGYAAVKQKVASGEYNENDLNKLEKDVREEYGDLELVPELYYTSRERVNNIYKPTTVADKAEHLRCMRYGIELDTADSYTNVIRGSKTQVGAPIMAINHALLIRDPNEYELGVQQYIEKKIRGMNEKKFEQLERRRLTTKCKEEEDALKAKPLDITDMPKHLKVDQQKHTTKMSLKNRLAIKKLNWLIEDSEKALEKEKDSEFNVDLFTLPELFGNKDDLARAKGQVVDMVENFQSFALHLPLFWYDEQYCISYIMEFNNLDQDWWSLPDSESCVDLWNLYKNMNYNTRYIAVKVTNKDEPLQIQMTDEKGANWDEEFKHEMCYIFKDNVWELYGKFSGKIYYLDMHQYEKQTRSTPLIVVSPDNKNRFLVNRGSYVKNDQNTFQFRIDHEILMDVIDKITSVNDKFVTIQPIFDTNMVKLTSGDKEKNLNVEYMRDDGRIPDQSWCFKRLMNEKINVSRRGLLRFLNDSFKIRQLYKCNMVEIVYNQKTDKITLRIMGVFGEEIAFGNGDECKTGGQSVLGDYFTSTKCVIKLPEPIPKLPTIQTNLDSFLGVSGKTITKSLGTMKKRKSPNMDNKPGGKKIKRATFIKSGTKRKPEAPNMNIADMFVNKREKMVKNDLCKVECIKTCRLRERGYSSLIEWNREPNHLYIGRDVTNHVAGSELSKWANPFILGKYDRNKSLEKYKAYVLKNEELKSSLHELKGKTLGCWCDNEPCHGNVLQEILKEYC